GGGGGGRRAARVCAGAGVRAALFAAAAAAVFSLHLARRRLASETVVAIGYLLAAASVIVILNSPHVSEEAHEVNDLLYGNAVAVPAGGEGAGGLPPLRAPCRHPGLYQGLVVECFAGRVVRSPG